MGFMNEISEDIGWNNAVDIFLSKVITEIIAKEIYENGNPIVHANPLKDAIKSIADDLKRNV